MVNNPTYCVYCGLQETSPYNSESWESTNAHQQVSGVHEEGIIDQSQHYIWSVRSSFMNKPKYMVLLLWKAMEKRQEHVQKIHTFSMEEECLTNIVPLCV